MNANPKSGKIPKAFWIILLLFCFTTLRPAQADVDINIFYDALAPYGNWVSHRNYGRVWYPRNIPRNWRPYTDGYWAYTIEYGWLWVSDWEWGWAPFHYGRWAWDDWYGWIWIPGRIWAPAWVFWRYGGGYTAWAPMPPNYIWRPYASYQTYYFNHNRYLNWDCWVAVHDRDFPRHRKHRRLLAPQQNKEILGSTNFINNVTFVNNNVVNQGMPVQQIEKATGDRIKPVVPRVLTEAGVENRQHRRNLRSDAPVIYRPKDMAASIDLIRDEEKRAMQIADKIEREPDTTPTRLLQPREPGRLTGKPRPIANDDFPSTVLKLPPAQPWQRGMPMLTVPDKRREGRIPVPNVQPTESIMHLNEEAEQQRQTVRQQQLQMQQQAEQEQRAREAARQQEELYRQQEIRRQQQWQMQVEEELRAQEKALQQEEKLYRQQESQRQQQWEIQQQAEQERRAREEVREQEALYRQQESQRQQQLEMQQQAEQDQRAREEVREQEEFYRQQESQRQQQWKMQQQAEQDQRAREEVRQQEELYRQQETQRQRQWEIQQQYDQGQRSRQKTGQQLEVVPQREIEQQQLRQQKGGQRQSEQTERGRVGRSINRSERTR